MKSVEIGEIVRKIKKYDFASIIGKFFEFLKNARKTAKMTNTNMLQKVSNTSRGKTKADEGQSKYLVGI